MFDSIRGPLQSVQRAELWGCYFLHHNAPLPFIWVLTISMFVMFLEFLDGRARSQAFELTFDGGLLTVIEKMILQRGIRSVRISEVKGHADDDMVAVGRVRVEDWVGNDYC